MADGGVNRRPGWARRRAIFADVFPVAVFFVWAAVFVALLVLNLQNRAIYSDSWAHVGYYFVFPAVLLVAVLAALFLPVVLRLTVALCLAAVVPAVYGAELYLVVRHSEHGYITRAGAGFDPRSKLQVLDNLKRQGHDAFPATRAQALLVGNGNGELIPALAEAAPLVPLASIPESTIVACNESRRWTIYRGDPHGFRNSREAWNGTPHIVVIGDSFVHGHCVDDDQTLPAQLALRFGRVLNLGTGGNGPLAELATLREYAEPLRPPVVPWVFYEGNDLTGDLGVEWRAPILRTYLEDPGFRQNLIGRRGEIAMRLRRHLDGHLTETMTRIDRPYEKLRDVLELYHLRKSLGLGTAALGVFEGDLDQNIARFDRVLAAATRAVRGWGGQLIFVYLPDGERYVGAVKNNPVRERIREGVLANVRAANLPLVDLAPVLSAAPDPASLYVFPGSHFNGAGYALVSAAIAADPAVQRATGTRQAHIR